MTAPLTLREPQLFDCHCNTQASGLLWLQWASVTFATPSTLCNNNEINRNCKRAQNTYKLSKKQSSDIALLQPW